MSTTLDKEAADTLERLGDQKTALWSFDEIKQYWKDGYDQFCRRTKCLFDYWAIENIPVTGNWQTDLERYLMEQKSGRGLTDQRMGYTAEHERYRGLHKYGGSMGVDPTPATSPHEAQEARGSSSESGGYFEATSTGSVDSALQKLVSGGNLPVETVELIQVFYDRSRLTGMSSQHLKELDPYYMESGGDPKMYSWDKDGLFYLRVIPRANGDADYVDVDGKWGRMRYTDVSTVSTSTAQGGWGILRYEEGSFPAGGPWGSPTRMHPHTKNIDVELYRLGRDPEHHCIELPDAYKKYVTYYAMSKAYERPGPGQDFKLSRHYQDRFMTGVNRMEKKRREMSQEYVGRLGAGPKSLNFGLGDPQPPTYDWDMEAPS